MKKIQVNGVELAYQVFGSGTQDMLFVHGFTGAGVWYEPMFNALSHHFRVIALDMRAHGGSAQITQGFSFKQMAGDIIAVVEALGLEKPVYAGHSMGGLLGLLSELEKPGTFQALVLITPAAATGAKGAHAESINRALEIHGDKAAMKNSSRLAYVKPVPEETLAAIIDTACLVDAAVHEKYLRQEFANLDITDRLHEIKPPVLFLNGSKDIVIPPEAQHQTALGLTNVKEVIFSDEGHMMPLESPQRTAREIAHFHQDIAPH